MLDAVRAEALKLRRHRATWLMVWIYPIVVALIVAGVLVHDAFAPPSAAERLETAARWIRDSAFVWDIPKSPPGRFLIAGFVAVVFAGEYGWNTWKLIIPARARWQLIAAKWTIAIGFLVLALVLADLIVLLGSWIQVLGGEKLPAGVTLAAIADAHLHAGASALLPILYTVAFAAMFAILTQSILATMILSIAIVILEGLLLPIGIMAYGHAPALTAGLIKLLPFYHMANLNAWARGAGLVLPLGPGVMLAMSWAASLAALMAWIAAAGAATQVRFLRQDLN